MKYDPQNLIYIKDTVCIDHLILRFQDFGF